MTDPAAARFLTEPIEVIKAVVMTAERDLDADAITRLITDVTPTISRQRQLARALDAEPDLLTSGSPHGPRSVELLIRALQAAGAKKVMLPRCAGCGKPHTLTGLGEHGRRICGSCYNRRTGVRETCGGCGLDRQVAARDRDGTARCRRCPPEPTRDHIAAICHHVSQVAGEVDPQVLRALVEQVLPRLFQRRNVSWELDARPELLTTAVAERSVRLTKLIDLLARNNIPGFRAAACPGCDREVAPTHLRDGRRCCRRCYDAGRLETCSGCGRAKPVAGRTVDGLPQCMNCKRYDPINLEQCTNCGKTRPIQHREDDRKLCGTCWRGYDADCSICGKRKPCYFAFTEKPRCLTCSRDLLSQHTCVRCGRTQSIWARDDDGGALCGNCARRRAPCCRCGRTMRVYGSIPDGPICGSCHKTEPAYFQHCISCGSFERLHHFGLCQRCACPPLLHQALADANERVRPELKPVIEVLLTTDPTRLLIWLRSPTTHTLLARLAAAHGPVTHEVLDRLTPIRSAKRLRDILVAAKFLPERDEYLAALQRWLDTQIAAVEDPTEKKLLRSFVTWTHLRRLRRRSPITFGQTINVKHEVRNSIALLKWLRANESSLSACTQLQVDAWLDGGTTYRRTANTFLAWAVRNNAAVNVKIPARDTPRPRDVFPDTDQRWTIARHLLCANELATSDRVAGLLLLLFAQPLSRIVLLTIEHVVRAEHGTQLKLGRDPIDLPEPLDALVLELVQQRRGAAALGHTDDHPWLFPGGSPGRHLGAARLGKRLKRLNIPARLSRNSALMELASELPATVISRLLGLDQRTADRWADSAGNTHQGYAAELARQRT